MEKGFAYVWLHLLLLALVFEGGYSIKCYVCSTAHDPNCHDPIASKMSPSECTTDLSSTTLQRFRTTFPWFSDVSKFYSNLMQGGSFTCIKVDTVFPHSSINSTVIRGCQFEKAPADDLCKTLSSHGQSYLKFCEVCNTDACNAADHVGGPSAIAAMLLPALAALYYLRQ